MNTTQKLEKQLKYKIPQLRLVLVREPGYDSPAGSRTPADPEDFLLPLKNLPEEHFVALHLNCKHG